MEGPRGGALTMKVLLIHNFYRSLSPSGEDTVYRNEVELLRRHGIRVITYENNNDDIARSHGKMKAAMNTIWSGQTYKNMRALIRKEKPDIAHIHNIWYAISPSAYYACRDEGVPVVQTVHNFRMFCANGLLMRDGRTCEECVGKMPWRALVRGCYNSSRVQSVPIALTEMAHGIMKTWTDRVDVFIALTEFGKKKLAACGLPENRIAVKPNFLLDPPSHSGTYDNQIVFIGRLSSEKGILVLLNAFKALSSTNGGVLLNIIGDGPLRKQVEKRIHSEGINNIHVSGRKDSKRSMESLGKAAFMVMPTICYEMFPLTTIEAFACGKAVVASRIGAMEEIVRDGKTGIFFEPGSTIDCAAKMKWMVENRDACIEMGRNARYEFESKYSADKNFEMVMKIYELAKEPRRKTESPVP